MEVLVLIQAFLLKFSSCVTVRRKWMNQNSCEKTIICECPQMRSTQADSKEKECKGKLEKLLILAMK